MSFHNYNVILMTFYVFPENNQKFKIMRGNSHSVDVSVSSRLLVIQTASNIPSPSFLKHFYSATVG